MTTPAIPPVIVAGFPVRVTADTTGTQGPVTRVTYDWGDGSLDVHNGVGVPAHYYNNPGTYVIRAQAFEGDRPHEVGSGSVLIRLI